MYHQNTDIPAVHRGELFTLQMRYHLVQNPHVIAPTPPQVTRGFVLHCTKSSKLCHLYSGHHERGTAYRQMIAVNHLKKTPNFRPPPSHFDRFMKFLLEVDVFFSTSCRLNHKQSVKQSISQ